ncbi:MAG: hypothetical protein KIT24_11365 [Phycisphaeraceae bacterium]|nr:hypothetical protein [Phycisphaeraceae bacterium]
MMRPVPQHADHRPDPSAGFIAHPDDDEHDFLPEPTTSLPSWVPLGIAMFGFVVLMHTLIRSMRRSRARTSDMSRPPKERLSELRQEALKRRDPVESLMADATELCQRLASQLDAKAARLEQLIARAESMASNFDRRLAETPTLQRSTHPPADSRPSSAPAEPLMSRVYALADQGLSPRDIAQEVDQPQGHVELMLNLRRL